MTRDVFDAAVERDARWVAGELAWLRRLAGLPGTAAAATEPYASQLAGDATGAADAWAGLGCPYDAALAGPACQRDHEPAGNGDGRLLWYGNICRPTAPPR